MRFSDVIVRQEVKDRLIHSVLDGRISHAQLFSGNAGNAALPLALAYAAFIQCEDRLENDSCGRCSSCIKHAKLIHPDLHFAYPVVTGGKIKEPSSADFINKWRTAILSNPYLDLNDWYDALGVDNKQGFMPVKESADILRKMSLKSFESHYKIQIIWMQEKMRVDASNKLLKLIEEPPDNTLFILITSDRESILPTILSRTQLVKIPQSSLQELSDALIKNYGKNAVEAYRIARLADGSVNEAIKKATEEQSDQTHENNFITWMRLCYNPFHEKEGRFAWADLNFWVEETAKSGREQLKQFISFCMEAARDCMVINCEAVPLARFDDSVIPNFSKFSRFIHQGNIAEITSLLNKAHYQIERNANPRILLLDLSFKMNRLLNLKREA